MKKIIILLTTFFLLSGCTIPRAVFKSSLINQDDPRYNLVEVTPTLKLSAPDTVP
ncbi:TPA: lipoprotein, partial [Salmonella enterica subsp. enterica serovar Typhi]|nr:lipoprotein [Salmonella enterica subsp. enterica serovar Typhi]